MGDEWAVSFGFKTFFCCVLLAGLSLTALAADYYVDATKGADSNNGASEQSPWRTLAKASSMSFQPGDRLLLKRGGTFQGSLLLNSEAGTAANPIRVSDYGSASARAVIDATGELAGLELDYSEYIEIENLEITGMGVLIETWGKSAIAYDHLSFSNLYIHDVGGTGVKLVVANDGGVHYKDISISDCVLENIGSFGITINKWGPTQAVDVFHEDVRIVNNRLVNLGDAGIQVGKIRNCLIQGNTILSPGFLENGNGSCLWTWYCEDLLAERNVFGHGRGETDACGAHIDIGNVNNIFQHNLSFDNEGGFVEILGLNRNSVYRYNISINDGARVLGTNDARQHGKTLWLGGWTGSESPKQGPYNSYVYNNTIYVESDIVSKYLMEGTADGALFANNVIYVAGESEALSSGGRPSGVIFDNNLVFENKVPQEPFNVFINNWAADPQFVNPGGLDPADYVPLNRDQVLDRGIQLYRIPGDPDGVSGGFEVEADFLGNPIVGPPDMGAIEVASEFGPAATFYFPQIGDGVAGSLQFQSSLIFVNTSSDTTAQIEFFATGSGLPMSVALGDSEASPIHNVGLKRGESISLQTPGTGQIQVGYARVQTGAGVSGVAVFGTTDKGSGVGLYEAGVPVTETLTEFTVFVDSMGNRDTGLAVVYPPPVGGVAPSAPSDANLTLRLYDKQFQLIAERALDPMLPGHHFARFVHQLFEDPAVVESAKEMQGVLIVSSNQPLAAVTLRQSDTPGLSFPDDVLMLTTFPVIPDSAIEN
jgi:hypothetical protein